MAYDAICLGLGAVGGAAVAELARRGRRVLGIDRFAPPHDQGSSHGRLRFIRQAYFEHPHYVPLAQQALADWHALQRRVGQTLFRSTGLAQYGPPASDVVRGVLLSARQHGLTVETLDAAEAARRWPGIVAPADWHVVYEAGAGVLDVERAVAAQLLDARHHGAELRINETVITWQPDGHGVAVTTDRGVYRSARLVVAAGAWSGPLLASLRVPLTVLHKPQYWHRPADDTYRHDRGCPGFLLETPGGVYYGFPQFDQHGVKVACHSGGRRVDDPNQVDRRLDTADARGVTTFIARHLPRLTLPCRDHSVCLYTMSADGHFIVDRHPEHSQVALAAGLSGHGFKFAPVLGRALADLALSGTSPLPIGFLALGRPGLRRHA